MFGDNLKKVRKEKGLSQEALAEKINVVRQTISKWEKGLSIPDGDMLIKLSQVLEVPVETLLGSKGPLENTNAVNQAIQFQIINSLLENSQRGSAKMSGIMILGAFISLIGAFFSVALMTLAKQYREQKQNDNDGNDLADVLASGPNGPGHGTIRAAGGSSFCGTGNCLACLNGAFYRVGGGCSGFHSVGKTSLFFFIHLEPVLSAGSGGQLFDD